MDERTWVPRHVERMEQFSDIAPSTPETGTLPEEKAVLVVPADTSELPRVREFLFAELDRHPCFTHTKNQLDIAVEELFVNVCKYAYKSVETNVARAVRLTKAFSTDPPSVTVEIIDSGVPFNPLAKPDAHTVDEFESIAEIPIGGLGIFMAKQNVDEMRYDHASGHNVITLVKLLDDRPELDGGETMTSPVAVSSC